MEKIPQRSWHEKRTANWRELEDREGTRESTPARTSHQEALLMTDSYARLKARLEKLLGDEAVAQRIAEGAKTHADSFRAIDPEVVAQAESAVVELLTGLPEEDTLQLRDVLPLVYKAVLEEQIPAAEAQMRKAA